MFLAAACGEDPIEPPASNAVPTAHLAVIQRDAAELKRFDVGVVDTFEGRAQGLSAFSPIEDDVGLVLAFESPARVCIFNGPVDYPIDVAYLDRDGEIRAIEQFDAREMSSRCHDGVLDVLEVRRDALDGVAVGDRVTFTPPIRTP
ncbi:MAG: DUF192 domain-containing protein [Myxococcota bacterium]